MGDDLPGIGHNSGRSDAPGKAWRTHVWRKARRELMPTLPIEVVRRRVLRAKELGLPYKTYAGLRASSGDDLIGFMFSSNALGVLRAGAAVPDVKAQKLAGLVAARTLALTYGPVTAAQVSPPAQDAAPAPAPLADWADVRRHLDGVFRARRMPSGRMVLITDQDLEREWLTAGRMAGIVSPAAFFTPPAP